MRTLKDINLRFISYFGAYFSKEYDNTFIAPSIFVYYNTLGPMKHILPLQSWIQSFESSDRNASSTAIFDQPFRNAK